MGTHQWGIFEYRGKFIMLTPMGVEMVGTKPDGTIIVDKEIHEPLALEL